MGRFLVTQVCTALLLGLVLGARPSRGSAACVGDCDGSGDVTVNELITMVNIALESAPLSSCRVGDADGSGDITINEIIAAVSNALGVCPLSATPTPTATPMPTPTLGPLGTRHFVLNMAHSPFGVVGVFGTSVFPLGGFQGQKNGQVGLPAYLDLHAGQPDSSGIARIDIVDASDYLYVDARAQAQIVFCIKPMVPVIAAGSVACNGGFDFSIGLTQNHHLGQIGTAGFTADQCASAGGRIESPNQICGAGGIGQLCRINSDCDSGSGTGDGVCGLHPATCRAPSGQQGMPCQANGDCDSAPGANDGGCGRDDPHPGVCNGGFQTRGLGGDSGPGAVSIAPIEAFGLNGLPATFTIEDALPCGDEGPGNQTQFAFTTAEYRATILNTGNMFDVCGAGNTDNDCATNADCDTSPGAGDGVCGVSLQFSSTGQNFSCANWQAADAPGCLVLSAPQLDGNPMTPGGDLITTFKFCGH